MGAERAVAGGINIDLLSIRLVNDMYAESGNDDGYKYRELADQSDFDEF